MVSWRWSNWSHMCVWGINHAFYLVPYIFPLTHFKFLLLRVQIYFTINSETIQLIVQRRFLLIHSVKVKNIGEKMEKSFFCSLDFHHNIDAYWELTPGFNCSQCSLVLCTHTILRQTHIPCAENFVTSISNSIYPFFADLSKLADTPCTQNHINGKKAFCIIMRGKKHYFKIFFILK